MLTLYFIVTTIALVASVATHTDIIEISVSEACLRNISVWRYCWTRDTYSQKETFKLKSMSGSSGSPFHLEMESMTKSFQITCKDSKCCVQQSTS